MPRNTSFIVRLVSLPKYLLKILFSASFYRRLPDADDSTEIEAQDQTIAPVAFKAADDQGALQLLSMLQQEARFIDFLQEDISRYQDAEVGAAARVIHEGAQRILKNHFKLAPIQDKTEGETVCLESGFDASRIRVTGRVVGEPPFKGILEHPGWQVLEFNLPKLAQGHDSKILTPAEVTL